MLEIRFKIGFALCFEIVTYPILIVSAVFSKKKNEEINEEKRQQNKQKDRLNVKNRATRLFVK